MPTFTDLGLSEPICRALDESGLGEPTAFQQRAISLFLHGRDLLLISATGPERTAAYLVPMLHRLSDPVVPATPKEPRALVLTAHRDEADAIGLALEGFGRHVSLRFLVSSSNSGWSQQDRQLRNGVEILVTTPKRLLDLMREKAVKLASIEIAVIDDVDQMIDEGLEPDLNKVVATLPGTYQTVAFAAAPAPELRPFVQSWMRNPLSIGGPTPAPRKATGKGAAGKKAASRVSTLQLPDWLDEPPPELMPDWLQDEPGTSAPASGAKKPKGTTRRVPTPAETAAAQPSSTAKKAGGKKPQDDLPAWLDDEPAAKAPASGAKKPKGTTRRLPTPAEAAAAQPSSAARKAGSGKPQDELPAWLDDEPAAAPASAGKTRKRGTPRVPAPGAAGDETAPAEAQPPPPSETPPSAPAKKAGTRRKGTRTGKSRRVP